MKKMRKFFVLILTISLILVGTTNSLAVWTTYSNNSTYLEETWLGSKQCINYYANGQWVRNVAGEEHTLWINSQPVLCSLYNTTYWCFDQWGNCFAIDTSQRLLLCRLNSTTFVVDTAITGCIGFQRDSNKFGYLVYTNNGTYSLSNLLSGASTSTTSINTNVYISTNNTLYSYNDVVTKYSDNHYHYNYNDREYCYELGSGYLFCDGELICDNTERMGFAYGYIVYVIKNEPFKVYSIAVGETRNATLLGNNFRSFIYDNNGWVSGVRLNSKTVNIDGNTNTSSNNNLHQYPQNYPYIDKAGGYYYYYTSSSKYYKYYLSGSTLYYKGTNSSSSSTLIATSVDKITFDDGCIAFALTSGKVYKMELGRTSSSYKELVGSNFDYFDEYDDYMSEGYYNTNGRYINF